MPNNLAGGMRGPRNNVQFGRHPPTIQTSLLSVTRPSNPAYVPIVVGIKVTPTLFPRFWLAPITSRDGFVALAKRWDPEDLPSNMTADVPLIEHHSRATHNNCGSQRDIDDYPTDECSYRIGGNLCTNWPTIHFQRRNLTEERRLPMQRGSRAVCQ